MVMCGHEQEYGSCSFGCQLPEVDVVVEKAISEMHADHKALMDDAEIMITADQGKEILDVHSKLQAELADNDMIIEGLEGDLELLQAKLDAARDEIVELKKRLTGGKDMVLLTKAEYEELKAVADGWQEPEHLCEDILKWNLTRKS